jgi:hypothetical protein
MLWSLISWTHSLFSCAGTHDLRTKTVFNIDPNGPDLFTGFPRGSGGPAFGGIPGSEAVNRGRYDTFESCRRCGLRPRDGKYEIW